MTAKSKAAGTRPAAARNGAGTNGSAKEPDPDKMAKAVEEVESEPQPKRVEFKGLTLQLPAELPAAVLFDLVELEYEGDNPIPVFRLLRSLLGSEQFVAVRNKVDAEEEMLSGVEGLIDAVFGQYGVTLGEAEASPDS